MKNTESNKTILLSEFYGKGATGQLIYDLSLKLSKKNKIYVISNREFKNNQSHNNTNLKLVNKGILIKNNPKSILLKTFKGLFFLFDSLIWILFNCNDEDKILLKIAKQNNIYGFAHSLEDVLLRTFFCAKKSNDILERSVSIPIYVNDTQKKIKAKKKIFDEVLNKVLK